MYDKIRFGSMIFDFVRLDYLNNDDTLVFYILPEGMSVKDIKQYILDAAGIYDYLDVNKKVVKTFSGYSNIDDVIEVKDTFDNEKNIVRVTVSKSPLQEAVEQNTVNIEYIAAMADIDLEG